MAEDKLLHALGFVADEKNELTVTKVRLRAPNGYTMSVAYSPDDDTIYQTGTRTKASSVLDSWTFDDYDEDEAAQWRSEGRQAIVGRLEAFFADKATTVNIET